MNIQGSVLRTLLDSLPLVRWAASGCAGLAMVLTYLYGQGWFGMLDVFPVPWQTAPQVTIGDPASVAIFDVRHGHRPLAQHTVYRCRQRPLKTVRRPDE